MVNKTEHTSEAGHWYKKDGTTAYTYTNKKGEEKPTTLREARKEGLVPSVTQIIAMAARPGLENWKADQILLSALTITREPTEPEYLYVQRIKEDAQEQAKKAREKGTIIHALVQKGFEGEPFDVTGSAKYYESAKATIEKEIGGVRFECEKSFAFMGYGGKTDLINDKYVIDIKTTEKDLGNIKTWDDHHMQLSAYTMGIPNPEKMVRKCGILYINVNTAESKLIWIDNIDLDKGWACFQALLDFYYAKTGLER